MADPETTGGELMEVSFGTTERDADKFDCLAMEQGKSRDEVLADAFSLYCTLSRVAAESPGGMFVYVVGDGYIELETGIPGEVQGDQAGDLEL